ncbi:MAG: alpha/beta hydrolase family protein [Candidatus Thiodiazotropha sp. (ex Dulcina madagascariensis)]|nr:alpha/beta hydrolase family protein [Candidatus Thiodiazotropha sp. (ex Dulcina madagascariensis)]
MTTCPESATFNPMHNTATQMRLILLLLAYLAPAAQASNLSMEQRIAVAIDRPTLQGKAVWLETGTGRFLAILNETTAPKRHGGALLLHDRGTHADWHEVINPLRRQLASNGWDSLSLQMPVSDDPPDLDALQALLTEASPRIQAAIDYLANRQIENLVFVGHGLGATMALNHATSRPSQDLRGIVAIGLSMAQDNERDPVYQAMVGLEIPILDLYGSRDLASVTGSAAARRAAAAKNPRADYRQDRVAGADHFFKGLQDHLVTRIRAWLRRTAVSATQTPKL